MGDSLPIRLTTWLQVDSKYIEMKQMIQRAFYIIKGCGIMGTGKNEHESVEINYEKWNRIVLITQLVLAGFILFTEILGNTMLYITRSQGYGPDTIVQKLLRYLVLTSVVNMLAIVVGQIIVRSHRNVTEQKYVLILTTEILCANAAFSHYQFTNTFGLCAIPIILTILYEDIKLCRVATLLGVIGLTIALVARGMDEAYNTDIGPEAAIGYMFTICIYAFATICLNTLKDRRLELKKALVEAERAKYLKEEQKMSIQMLEALAQAIDAKDRYTNGHSYRVSEYACKLAFEIGCPEDEVEIIRQEALLHDIGKIGIPDSILNKPGKLTEIEYNVMKSHTTAGEQILKDMIMIPEATAVAGEHHERYDGNGYPRGIVGKAIHPHARIVGIADAYDAMNSDRVYRKALAKNVIREQLEKGRGTQFDPDYVDVFLKLFDEGKLRIDNDAEAAEQQDVQVIENMTGNLNAFLSKDRDTDKRQGATDVGVHNFEEMYEYVQQLKKRYQQHTFELVMITTEPLENVEITEAEWKRASFAMGMAIKSNIRAVDIYTRYSKSQHLAVLTNAGVDNIEMIIQRIFLDYYKLCDIEKFALSYELGKEEDKI